MLNIANGRAASLYWTEPRLSAERLKTAFQELRSGPLSLRGIFLWRIYGLGMAGS